MLFKVPRLYDSHAHFLGTGQIRMGLNLANLTSPQDLQTIQIENSYMRGDWLLGFGWDENNWIEKKLPSKEILDQYFPNTPVFFSRADGHSSWLNSKALELLNILNKTPQQYPDPMGGFIHRDAQGLPTGILSESAHMMVFEHLPGYSDSQVREFLLKSCEIFNQAGFTHVRDMTCSVNQWQQLTKLQDQQLLTIALDANFTIENKSDLERGLKDCLYARENETSLLRAKGLKFFYDGSLGSETALLSKPYHGKPNGNRGIVTWNLKDLEEAMQICWKNNLEFSVHTIGDEAAHHIVEAARKVSASGAVGKINLEHAEVIRPETIQMMKPLHIWCHMQPCHWLSDRRWLKDKLAELYKYAFPWEALRLAQIPISFGSDSPIEAPSLSDNLKALKDSVAEGIRELKADPLEFHSHPDKTFADSQTIFENGQVKEIIFNGRNLTT